MLFDSAREMNMQKLKASQTEHEELLRAVRACLAAFKTTFEEDKAVCGAWANADSTGAPFVSAAALQDRSAAIAFVKVRERQILLSTENYLRGTLRNGP